MLAAALVVALLLNLAFSSGLTTLQERLGALGWTWFSDETVEQRITLVTVDEKSLAELGAWPWSRDVMAALTRAIDAAGAQLQLHDIVYTEARAGDAEFALALENARGSVLAQVPVLQSNQVVQSGQITHPLSGITCSGSGQLPSTPNFLAPNSRFAAIPKGHITPIISSDGAVRKTPAVICVNGQAYPALALTSLLQATGSEQWAASLQAGDSLFGPAQTLNLLAYPGLDVPLDAEGNIRISFTKHPSSYQAVSAVDVLNGNFDAGLLDRAWVLVGATAFGMGDIVPTPYNGATAGVELQARLLGSLLDVSIPYTPRAATGLLGLLSLLAAIALFGLAGRDGRGSAYGLPAAALLLPVAALLLHIQLLNSMGLWLGWVFPALYSLLAASFLLLLEQGRVRAERTRVFGNLSSYLPSDIAREIAYSLPSSSINARRTQVTLLSADLRNFSAFGESQPAEESAAMLHFFFTQATRVIEQHGGRVHEFRGDGLLAVWDGHDKRAAQQALLAGKALQAAMDRDLLPDYAPDGLQPLALGIGIEQGPVLIGSIGPAHRRSHALLGDTVTIVLRIQELTAELAQPILIGTCAARQLDGQQLESQGSYLLSGLRTPHTLFAPAYEKAQVSQPDLKVVAGGRE